MTTKLITSLSSLQVHHGSILGSHWPELDLYYTSKEIDALLAFLAVQSVEERMEIIQVQKFLSGTYASSTSNVAITANPPLISEGAEFLAVTITPQSLDNYLLIMCNAWVGSTSALKWYTGSIFNTEVHATNALATDGSYLPEGGLGIMLKMIYYDRVVSLNPNPITFRAGASAGTIGFSGTSGDLWGPASYGMILAFEIAL